MPYATINDVPQSLRGAGLNLAQANRWGTFYDKLKAGGADDASAAAQAWSITKRIYKKVRGGWTRKSNATSEAPGFYIRPPAKELGESMKNPSGCSLSATQAKGSVSSESGRYRYGASARYKLAETEQGEPHVGGLVEKLFSAANRLQTMASTRVVIDVQETIQILRAAEMALREIAVKPIDGDSTSPYPSGNHFETSYGNLPSGINPYTLNALISDIIAENSDWIYINRTKQDQLVNISDALRNFALKVKSSTIKNESAALGIFRRNLAEMTGTKCPECGKKNPTGAAKCATCGHSMTESCCDACAKRKTCKGASCSKTETCGSCGVKDTCEGANCSKNKKPKMITAKERFDRLMALQTDEAEKKIAGNLCVGGAGTGGFHKCGVGSVMNNVSNKTAADQAKSNAEFRQSTADFLAKIRAQRAARKGSKPTKSSNSSKSSDPKITSKQLVGHGLGNLHTVSGSNRQFTSKAAAQRHVTNLKRAKKAAEIAKLGKPQEVNVRDKHGSYIVKSKDGERQFGSKSAAIAHAKRIARGGKVWGSALGEAPISQVLEQIKSDFAEKAQALRGKMIRYGAAPAMSQAR